MQWVMKNFAWSPKPSDRLRWREEVESLKRKLSTEPSASIKLGEKEVFISREDFAEATATLSARLRPVVRRCLRDAGVTPGHLDGVLLVGGATRMSDRKSVV